MRSVVGRADHRGLGPKGWVLCGAEPQLPATNGLNEAAGTAHVDPAEWSAQAGRTRAGP